MSFCGPSKNQAELIEQNCQGGEFQHTRVSVHTHTEHTHRHTTHTEHTHTHQARVNMNKCGKLTHAIMELQKSHSLYHLQPKQLWST